MKYLEELKFLAENMKASTTEYEMAAIEEYKKSDSNDKYWKGCVEYWKGSKTAWNIILEEINYKISDKTSDIEDYTVLENLKRDTIQSIKCPY